MVFIILPQPTKQIPIDLVWKGFIWAFLAASLVQNNQTQHFPCFMFIPLKQPRYDMPELDCKPLSASTCKYLAFTLNTRDAHS